MYSKQHLLLLLLLTNGFVNWNKAKNINIRWAELATNWNKFKFLKLKLKLQYVKGNY